MLTHIDVVLTELWLFLIFPRCLDFFFTFRPHDFGKHLGELEEAIGHILIIFLTVVFGASFALKRQKENQVEIKWVNKLRLVAEDDQKLIEVIEVYTLDNKENTFQI